MLSQPFEVQYPYADSCCSLFPDRCSAGYHHRLTEKERFFPRGNQLGCRMTIYLASIFAYESSPQIHGQVKRVNGTLGTRSLTKIASFTGGKTAPIPQVTFVKTLYLRTPSIHSNPGVSGRSTCHEVSRALLKAHGLIVLCAKPLPQNTVRNTEQKHGLSTLLYRCSSRRLVSRIEALLRGQPTRQLANPPTSANMFHTLTGKDEDEGKEKREWKGWSLILPALEPFFWWTFG